MNAKIDGEKLFEKYPSTKTFIPDHKVGDANI
jgi:hypothetical protein